MKTRPTTGVHGVNLTIDGVIDSFEPLSVDRILSELFGLSFKDFYLLGKSRAYERYYSACYSHKNLIFIYTEGRTDNNCNSVHLEIKGSAFDTGLVDEERMKGFCLSRDVKASDFDIYNDDAGEILKFDKLKRQIDRHYVKSKYNVMIWPGRKEGDPRTIYFGAKPQRLCIYEKGLLSAQERKFDYPLDYIRLEVQLAGEKAEQAFKRWCRGEKPGALASSLIAAMVEFKSLKDTDKNNHRRKVCPDWARYLGDTEKLKLTVQRKGPDKNRQLDAFDSYLWNRFIEHGFDDIASRFFDTASRFTGEEGLRYILHKLTESKGVVLQEAA